MADPDERRRVLDMLAEGRISADDAANLLKALGEEPPRPGAVVPKPPRKATARNFRVSIDVDDGAGAKTAKVRVNIPVGLARFASRFLPPEAKAELDAQGIDIEALIEGLGEDVPEGPLVDIDVDDGAGAKQAKIIIEVV